MLNIRLPHRVCGFLLALLLALVSHGALGQASPSAPPGTDTASSAATAAIQLASAPATALPPSSVRPPVADAAPADPYSLRSVVVQGDSVTRLTLAVLAVMSVLSWYVIVAKLLEQRRLDVQASAAQKLLASNDSLHKRFDALAKDSAFRPMLDSALEAARRHASVAGQVDMNSWLSQNIVRSVSTLQMRSQTGLSVLATVGATAPFVGLFGTVWGIYNALVTIGLSGQASIDKVAGPVGEALIMTALGLAVAVPAVLGYNGLVRRNRVSLHHARGLGSELHTQLLVELEKSQRAGAGAAGSGNAPSAV